MADPSVQVLLRAIQTESDVSRQIGYRANNRLIRNVKCQGLTPSLHPGFLSLLQTQAFDGGGNLQYHII